MKKLLILGACIPALALADASSADLKFKGIGAGSSGQIEIYGKKLNVGVVQQKFHMSNVTKGSSLYAKNNQDQNVYCVDLSQWTDTKDTNKYCIVTADQLDALKNCPGQAQRIAALNSLWDCGLTGKFGNAWETTNNDYATAFQLMAWELEYDFNGAANSVNLGSGNFKYNTNMTAGAVSIFNELKSKVVDCKPNVPNNSVVYLKNDCLQDYVCPVPEPSTWAAMAAGVAILARRRRKN